ncbi:MAG: hypothetical protein WCI22_03545 [Actinomycetota bacterium]
MASWWVKRKLQQNTRALAAAREELRIADEQSFYIDEGDAQLEATDRFRVTMRDRISRLEAEQDTLLDELSGGGA